MPTKATGKGATTQPKQEGQEHYSLSSEIKQEGERTMKQLTTYNRAAAYLNTIFVWIVANRWSLPQRYAYSSKITNTKSQ